ncbi:hypothetical protein DL769_001340 [Monosporascus sp. CRB-8-3]|nr:hypothetical protein DL769_001340 [Monosporascus sp. CRB-8-3]
MMSANPTNKEFISSIEQSLCAGCLDDSAPENSEERGDAFMKDDNTNRWLDKTVSFIIRSNGASATFYEYSAVDGFALYGLQGAIARADEAHDPTAGSALRYHEFKGYGAAYLRSQKMPPQSIFQIIIQVAVRRHSSYDPMPLDVVGPRQFLHGRVETFNLQTADVAAFCAVAGDEAIVAAE